MIVLKNLLFIFYLILFTFGIINLGIIILKILKLEEEKNSIKIIFSFITGSIVFTLFILFIGRTIFINKNLFFIIFIILILFFFINYKWWKNKFLLIKNPILKIKKEYIFLYIIVVFIILRVLYAFFSIFVPPIAWDSLAYHYAIPKIYMLSKKIIYIPFMYHSNWPEHMELMYTYLLTLFNTYVLLNGISFIYSMFLLIVIYIFSKEFFNKKTGVIAVALIISTTIFKNNSSNGYVDISLSFFTVASLFAYFLWLKNKEKKYIILASIASAGAASVKILGLFSFLILPIFILFTDFLLNKDKKNLYIKEAVLFILISFLLFSPWYIKSYIDTGNPVWPFLYDIFGGKNWSYELSNFRHNYYARKGSGRTILDFFIIPWTLIKADNIGAYIGNHIILYCLLLPFLFYEILVKRYYILILISIYSFIFLIFWFFTAQMTRFLFPGFSVFTLIFAFLIQRIIFNYKNKLSKITISLYLIFLLLYSFPFKEKKDFTGIGILTGLEKKEKFLERNLDNYNIYKKINKDKTINEKILLLKEIRGYYLNKKYIWGDPVNQGIIRYKDKKTFLKDIKKYNIKYILLNFNIYNNAYNDGYTDEIYTLINIIIKNYCKKLYCKNNVCLYKLKK